MFFIPNYPSMIHLCIAMIHPFEDRNGRTSRLLMNYIQARFNLPLSIVFKQDRIKYVEALESTRNKEDILIFYRFMYDQYGKFLKSEIDQLGGIKAVKETKKPNQTTDRKKTGSTSAKSIKGITTRKATSKKIKK